MSGIFAGFLIAFSSCATSSGAEALDTRRDRVVEAVERVLPSVVNIATEEIVPIQSSLDSLFREFFDPYYRNRPPNTQLSLGSGVIIDEEGFVLTNFHVVSRARRVWVRLHDGREFEAERIAGTSFTDLALLKIRAPKEEKFSAVRFALDDDLLLGETVLALGNPFGLGGSVSRGILSSKSRRPVAENQPLDVPDWLQTDASINPGNSGGPLVNLRGDLIGISVAIHREGQGIGFAIPIKRICAALADIYSPELLENVWFGARVRPVTPLQVSSVQVESPAGQAGLRPGDLILKVNGREPRSFIDFNRELVAAKDERDVTLLVQRGSGKRSITFRMIPEKAFFNEELIRKRTGIVFEERIPRSVEPGLTRVAGLWIGAVDRGSPGASANLAGGMIVTSADNQAVTDVVALAKLVHGKAKGEALKLDLIIPRQQGFYLSYVEAKTTVKLR